MTRDIEFGAFLVTFGDLADPEALARLARTADGNCAAVCVGDHISLPVEIPDEYPFSPTGESPFEVDQDAVDAFQTLAYLAAETAEVRLGTNTAIIPYRHPVTMTKHALTLDTLSDGRFEFGLAPGWLRTEFEVLDVPFEERGSRTDEFLDIYERACAEGQFAFEGEHHSFQETGFHPRPVQNGGPPAWIGGYSGASFRRVAEYGHGWTVFSEDPADLSGAVDRLETAWDDYDRAGDPPVAVTTSDYDVAFDGEEFVGDVEGLVDRIAGYADAGATRVFVMPQAMAAPEDAPAALDRFLEEVAPRV